MKKASLFIVMFLCTIGMFTVFAEDIDDGLDGITFTTPGKYNSDLNKDTETVKADEEASKDSVSLTDKAKEELKEKEEKKDNKEENKGLAKLPDGTAYVGVYSYLNLRDAVWGNITAQLYNNEEVTITGRDGDWYKVTTSKGEGYVHARYIFASKDQRHHGNEVLESDNPNGNSNPTKGSTDVIINVDGDSIQGKVVSAAKQIHDKYQGKGAYPYHKYTEGGNLGCAQVATSVLVAAGVLAATDSCGGLGYASLNCTGTISLLEKAGWTSVKWPPYQAGDVVFWETYKPGPSHVGIVMNSGNSAQAMNNSSKKRMPSYSDITSMKICKIMRKC